MKTLVVTVISFFIPLLSAPVFSKGGSNSLTPLTDTRGAVSGNIHPDWAPGGDNIRTRWAEKIDPHNPLPEYPRPQMIREKWMNLNGQWNYGITDASASDFEPEGKILVPFAVESSLSGVGKRISKDDALWYERTFTLPEAWREDRILLHFGAVDWQAEVEASYYIPETQTSLTMRYLINNEGAIRVTQTMKAGPSVEIPPMFRFGVRFRMPSDYDTVEYYGRGPVENYADRNSGTPVGLYRQSVSEQSYPYIRPQETGTRTDLRWIEILDWSCSGLKVFSDVPFSASALEYSMESLDDGAEKDQRHSPEVPKADFTEVCVDKVQMGLGCVDSWGSLPRPEYMVEYGDYEFSFIIAPAVHAYSFQELDF